MRDTVYVFARAPRLGSVKRRLAREIGAMAALRIYRAMLTRTLRRLAADRRFRTVIAATPDRAMRNAWPVRLEAMGQGDGDLQARMSRIVARHRRGRVAIVGSDIPDLTANDVARAFRLLGQARACFGPASDGGYYLVALGPLRPSAPFAHVRWSSQWALADTLANFLPRRPVALLRTLRDVDTARDLPTR